MVSVLGEKVRGTAVKFNTFILFVGASVGPVLAINLIDLISYEKSFMALGVILWMGLIITIFIRVDKKA